jgi:hypothetical protein
MNRNFQVITNEIGREEKLILPRFPFCYMTFRSIKDQERSVPKVFEITDITEKGMQLHLKDGKHDYHKGSSVQGSIHWKGLEMEVLGRVHWSTSNRVGVEMEDCDRMRERFYNLLSIDNIIQRMKPLHKTDLELPANLKYWVRSDGPVEIFMWRHNDGEISKFQVIYLDKLIEWEDGQGLKTGDLISKRDHDTPLTSEDEFIFVIDDNRSDAQVDKAIELVNHIPDDYLTPAAKDFLLVKLRH